jgi:hypothetical protein
VGSAAVHAALLALPGSPAYAQSGPVPTGATTSAAAPAATAAGATTSSAASSSGAPSSAGRPSPTGGGAPSGAPAAHGPGGAFELDHATTWDLVVEGAFGRYFGGSDRWSGLGRARAGVLFVRDPVFDAIGLSFESSSLSKATFGLEVEALRIDGGYWGELGALLDVTGRPGALLSGGWSVFGLECQVRSVAGLGLGAAVYAKLSVPIGTVVWLLGERRTRAPLPKTNDADPR